MVASVGGNKGNNVLNALGKAQKDKESFLEKLASGKRINKSQDDAAGLAIVAALEAEGATSRIAIRNTQDTASAISIAEGAMGQMTDMNTRMQELALQASNGVLSDEQRAPLVAEFNQLKQELERVTATTEFNGKNLLNGDSIRTQVGTDASSNSQIEVPGLDVPGLNSTLSGLDISSAATAQSALSGLSNYGQSITSARGQLGAASSRLDMARENLQTAELASEQAASRIRDVDVASTSANLVASNIRSSAGVALAAQANQTASNVLNLLQ